MIDTRITHLTTEELAARLHITTHALYRWRAKGDGPPFIKISRRKVLYRIADVEAWEQERLRRNTAEQIALDHRERHRKGKG